MVLHPENLEILTDDLVQLDDVSPMTVVDNLRRRLSIGKIYTNVGDILIALNPYKQLPIYTPNVLDQYINESPNLPPHIFGLCSDVFNNLVYNKVSQAILISGESGAGKTEATKQCFHYLTEVSMTKIEDRIIKGNPVLEAFGNAKTLRNDNSSRFGKYMQVCFNENFVIVGCSTTNFLLEKSRVVSPSIGERNYHIMYQLCAGGAEAYPSLHLKSPMNFKNLFQGSVTTIDGVDDAKDFSSLQKAMETLGFDASSRQGIFSVVAAV